MSRARTQAADAMIGTTSVCTLLAGASIISPDLRTQIVRAIADDPAGYFSGMASGAMTFAHMISRTFADYRVDNLPLFGFGIVALVLTVMMVRS
jgi:hypothetical protein